MLSHAAPDELNGLSKEKLNELLSTIDTEHEKVRELGTWRTRVKWLGGLKSKSYMRSHSLLVDEAADLAGVDTAPNSVECVLSALGACVTAGFVFNATKRGIRIYDLEVALEGNINNILRFLGLSQTGHPGYEQILLKLYVRADAETRELSEIWKYTVETSPVANTLSRQVSINPQISIIS
ncbi:MAG: OsmC family protein [Candidatus Bathyarchaeia archaeon]